MRTRTLTILALVLLASTAGAAVFQYRVGVETPKGKQDAFLWIPPEAPQVRGVVMGGMTLMEREMARDPVIREACAAEGLAIVFTKCGLRAIDVPALLQRFAEVSGYAELPQAPLFFVGHSAGGPQAKKRAIRFADRCFGLLQYRGGVPGGDEAVPPGVPTLMMVGQFDEFGGLMRDENGREGPWERARDALVAYRGTDPAPLASLVVEPGAGHFAWSKRNAEYLALYLRKAARARIPGEARDSAEPVACTAVDPAGGWLTGIAITEPDAGGRPTPADRHEGDAARTSWHFDKELAEATVAYHAGGFGKRDQFIKWTDPYWVDAGARYFFTKITWVDDGQTFEVHPSYRDTYPTPHKSGGPRWLEAGKPCGHSSAPIRVKGVSGPVAAVGPARLRIHYDNLTPADERSRATFMAFSEGDHEYRHTEHVGMLPRGFKGITKGTEQTLSFPAPGNLRAGGPPLKLTAASSAGLPVEYYVAYGPAIVKDGALHVAELPARATRPVEVKVVACQFGRGTEPPVKTAVPVAHVIQVVKAAE